MRDLLIILRTCQRVNMIHDNGGGRYIKVSKHELINVCMSSLVDSINKVKDHNVQLVVLDDHSNPESIKDFKTILGKCNVPTEFIPIEDGTGNAHSLARVYELVEQRCTDLWYHVEDDYLHFPQAIQDMLDSATQFEQMTGKMVAFNPHDDPWRYSSPYPSFILFGPHRHYRTVKHTTYTCLASKQIYDKYKNHFQDVVKLTHMKADWVEDKTINLVWNKEDVILFSPIPGLALHIMDESGKDPYIDVSELWNNIPEFW